MQFAFSTKPCCCLDTTSTTIPDVSALILYHVDSFNFRLSLVSSVISHHMSQSRSYVSLPVSTLEAGSCAADPRCRTASQHAARTCKSFSAFASLPPPVDLGGEKVGIRLSYALQAPVCPSEWMTPLYGTSCAFPLRQCVPLCDSTPGNGFRQKKRVAWGSRLFESCFFLPWEEATGWLGEGTVAAPGKIRWSRKRRAKRERCMSAGDGRCIVDSTWLLDSGGWLGAELHLG